MKKYGLEFILVVGNCRQEEIEDSLAGLGDGLAIVSAGENGTQGRELKISINTEDPTLIFDSCSQFGKLKSVKID